MSLVVLFVLLIVVVGYWVMTQILPEREKNSLLRPTLGTAFLDEVNERRHTLGLPLLEIDDALCEVAERKAVHQIMTGVDAEGWEYPQEYDDLFGRSLLMETLLMGPVERMPERLARQRDLFDGEWITCGVGVAGGKSERVVVALVLCRQAWEPAPASPRSILERAALGK